jgi:hypothetical protein
MDAGHGSKSRIEAKLNDRHEGESIPNATEAGQ